MYKQYIKPTVDWILCVIVAVLGILPIVVIGIIIKIDSPGPIFFRQERLGKGKKVFRIYKFRTMCENAYEKGGIVLSESDPRITRVGKVLRRTSIDEIPQIFNILSGKMSIIGPRPILDWEYEEHAKKEYETRFSLKPGMFCTIDLVARNASREQQFLMDVEYCKTCSFLTDFKTFIKIISIVVSGKNVYREDANSVKKQSKEQ